MSTNGSPPTTEIGYVVPGRDLPGSHSLKGPLSWAAIEADAVEYVPQLRWPQSVKVYDKMRSDPQIDALLRGMTLPIRKFRWLIDPEGASEEVTTKVAEDFGLPVLGRELEKPKGRKTAFNHADHIRIALLGLVYGHMFFEQVGGIENDMWRLHKLAPRMPHTIADISVARDGGLEWIEQLEEWDSPRIPISRLVAYVFDKEGANWFGRPLIRSAYQPWLLKDRLLRVDAVRHERNGMGVPFVEMPERATTEQKKQAQNLVTQYRAGMGSGGTLPFGFKVSLKGVEGVTSDVLASIRYHDEAIAKLMLQMFANMGGAETSGSKFLGDTFVKFFAKAQESVADWVAETQNFYVIRDWVDWNYGEDEPAPCVIYKRDEDPELGAHEFAQMVAQGVITVDEPTEQFLRDRYGLPPLAPGTRKTPEEMMKMMQDAKNPPSPNDGENSPAPGETNKNVAEPPPSRPSSTPTATSARGPLSSTTRYRRNLTDIEAASQADFLSMQQSWETLLRQAVATFKVHNATQIEQILGKITAASSVAELKDITPELLGVDEMAGLLQQMAESGSMAAAQELFLQGFPLSRPPVPDMSSLAGSIAEVVRNSLGASASRQAVRVGPGEGGADAVRAWASTLTDTYLEETLGGALTAAQNAGRFSVFAQAGDNTQFFASEIMDGNTCTNCAQVDGKHYASLEEGMMDYPGGTYAYCLAGTRCRGTLVALTTESQLGG